MKLVSVRDFRSKPAEVWKSLQHEHDLVLTNNGKPIALLSEVDEASLELALRDARSARALRALDSAQRRSAALGLDKLPLEEINREIAAARKGRRRA